MAIDLKNKTILITGASDGIGKNTAFKLASMGANLILVGRNEEKTRKVLEQVKSLSNSTATHLVFLSDLSLSSQVKKLAEEIKKNTKKIDVLFNNAGAFFQEKSITAEGLESTFALNHLNYFLLTHHLLDLLLKAESPRIVNTASQAHVGVDIDFDNLQGERSYSGWKAYQMSKLENILFSYELAERLKNSNITVNSFHPGFVDTNFGENNGGFFGNILKVAKKLIAINEDKGSETSTYLCSSPEVEGISGKYFDKCKVKTSSAQSRNVETRKKLWMVTEEILKKYLT
jgi:retinol dehydrogenase-12